MDLKDFRENYHSVAYEALEFEQSNTPVKKSLFLEPIKPNEVLIKVSYVGVCETDFEVGCTIPSVVILLTPIRIHARMLTAM